MLVYIVSLLVVCIVAYNISVLGLSFTYTLAWIVLPFLFLVLKGMILKKAGVEYWKILIPFYGTYTFFKTMDLNENICGIATFVNIYSFYDWLSHTFSEIPKISDLLSRAVIHNESICVPFAIFFCMLGITNLVTSILLSNNLAKSFGKSVGFAIGLFLLPFIAYPILAFDESKYCFSYDFSSQETE